MPESDSELAKTIEAPLVAPNGDSARPVDLSDTGEVAAARRYYQRSVLGVGGMGEVHLVRDHRIGRDVAMKVAREGASDPRRFLREARVQGQLEHPAIVPVYDLAYDDDEQLYFTMKRVRGVTLEGVLARVAGGDEEARAAFGRRKLLSAFVSACLAIDFAHSRGVVHRDLKPSNMMLGDFGEVYVLDWGIAKLVHDEEPESLPRQTPRHGKHATEAGIVLGTPGYMAPEQLRGEALGARADVYALGAILYEILCGERLHDSDNVVMLATQTLAGDGDRIRTRCRQRDVPPELEAICVQATMVDPSARFASARELSNAIERFLDGDQDLARRRELADGHAAEARASLAAALDPTSPDDAARRKATREAGRAIALDPSNDDAARTLVTLITSPPAVAPPDVMKRIERYRADDARIAGTMGMIGWLVIGALSPFLLWMGVRDWTSLAIGFVAIVVGAVTTWGAGKWPRRGRALVRVTLLASALLLAVLTRLYGPLFYVPGVALGAAIALGSHPYAGRWGPYALVCAGMLVPLGLEFAGVLPASYSFDGATLTVHAGVAYLPRVPTLVFLTLSGVFLVLSVGLYALTVRRALDRAQRKLLLQTWQLQQLLPRETLAPTVTGRIG
ncbi:MAG TPA: serine/threonine-protein kinase [Polyangiaceae bacterium]|jgi:serine/threonine-protein kinase